MKTIEDIRDLIDQGMRKEAIEELDNLLELGPNNIEGLRLKCVLLAQEGRLPEERMIWEKIISIDPENIEAQCYFDLQYLEEREKYLLSLFKKTRLDFTKGVHLVTHYSPFNNRDYVIEERVKLPCVHYNPMLIIAYNGTILHCCDDYVGHFGLGNVNTMTLKEIWESKKHSDLVETLSEHGGRMHHPYCANCPR